MPGKELAPELLDFTQQTIIRQPAASLQLGLTGNLIEADLSKLNVILEGPSAYAVKTKSHTEALCFLAMVRSMVEIVPYTPKERQNVSKYSIGVEVLKFVICFNYGHLARNAAGKLS